MQPWQRKQCHYQAKSSHLHAAYTACAPPFACTPATHTLLSRLADQAAIRPMRCVCVGVSNRTRKYPNNSRATLISAHTHPLNGLAAPRHWLKIIFAG